MEKEDLEEIELESIIALGNARKDLKNHTDLFKKIKAGDFPDYKHLPREVEIYTQASAIMKSIIDNCESPKEMVDCVFGEIVLPFFLLMEDHYNLKGTLQQ